MQKKPHKSKEDINFITLLNFIVDPAVIVDENGLFLAVNHAFEETTGLNKKDLINKPFLEIENLPTESKALLLKNLKKRMHCVATEPYEITFQDKNDEKRVTEVKAKKISYAQHPADLVLFHDVTRRKENAKRLEEYSEKMEALVDEKVREIRESKKKLETIFDSSPDAITVTDLNGTIIECNGATARLHGFPSRQEVIGKNAFDLISPKDRQKAATQMKAIRKSGSMQNLELIFLTKNGKQFPAEASANIIRNVQGKPIGYVAVTKDISERKNSEEKLKASEKHFRETLDNMIEGCQIVGYDWCYLYVNDTAAKHGRKPKEKLLGKTMMEVYPGIENTEMFSTLKKSMEKRVTALTENEFTFPNSRKGWFELRVQPVPEGIFILSMDITERKKAEEALRESEEKFRNLSEESPNMIFIYKQGSVVYANKKCEDLMGYTKEEFYAPTFNFFTLIAPESLKKMDSSHRRHGAGQEVEPFEYTLVTKAKKRISAVINSKLIKYEGETATLGIITDITELEQTENELQEARKRYTSLFDRAPLGIIVIDPETFKPVEFNDVAHQQLGYSREEFSKLSISDFEANETPAETRKHTNRILKDGRREFETRHRTKNGDIRNVLVTTKPIVLHGKTFIHCIFHDITDIRKVQNALMKSESKYRQLVELAQEGIWALDKNFKTVFVNPRMAQMLGYPQSEMSGKSVFEFLDKGNVKKAKRFLRQFKHGVKGQFEHAFPRRDGTQIYTRIAASDMQDDQGQSIGTLALVADITERKQAEEALKKSEERAKAIVANSPIGIATSSTNKQFLSANEAFCKILGYTEDELRKLTFKDVTYPSDLEESMLKMKELEAGTSSSFKQEKRYLKKDGRVINGKIMISAIRDQADKPILFIAELEDITEQKRAEEKLSKSEKKYRHLFVELKKAEKQLLEERDRAQNYLDVASVMLVALNTEGRVTLLNRRGCEVLKCRAEDALGKNWFDNFVPDGVRRNVKKVFKLLIAGEAGMPEYNENYVLSKNGEKRLIAWSNTVLKNSSGQIMGTLSSGEDITEKRKIENDLKLERDKLEAVTENIGAGLGIISRDYQILWANKLMKQINGECEGKRCYSTFNKLTDVCPDCGVKKVFENGVSLDVHEYSNLDDKGNRFWIELIVTPIKDEKGNVTSALELAVNISERKILQNKLAEYSQKLEKLVEKRTEQLRQTQAKLVKSERLAAIGELAAMVGHDLRNPLTGIKGAAYYLNSKYRGEINSVGKAMLKTIDECIEHSNKIINDLLEYSRDLKLELTETSPKALLTKSMQMVKIPKKIQVSYDIEANPVVKMDVERMKRVFVNIFQNAVDAMPDNGTLTLKSIIAGDNLQISVTDTGTGMSKKTVAKLWTPLFTTKARGMGFGLSICKRIVEAHKGRISVKSKIGKGSTFTVTIPLHPKPDSEAELLVFNGPALSTAAQLQETR
jgi:PAS domain S-box-containing protein